MNAYIESVIETVKKKHGNEPEFVQTVEEVLTSLDPVISAHPEYEAVDLLGRRVSLGADALPLKVVVPPSLIQRESVCPPGR